jgi:hypothetical protein
MMLSRLRLRHNCSLSAHWGERAGVRWESAAGATYLTLPSLRDGPLPLPPMGGEGL